MTRQRKRNNPSAWKQATRYLAHGVNSPVRACGAVGGEPVILASGQGAWVRDTRGRRYLDFVGGWGPLILGHAPTAVVKAVQRQVVRGTTLGFPTELETELARRLCQAFPSIDCVRMTCSGTEACMSAIRLARAVTGRTKIITCAGCYHGHADSFLVRAGSGVATFGASTPSSAGVPELLAHETLTAHYNDLAGVQRIMQAHGADVAAMMVEPCAANMGLVLPQPGFLAGLREITRQWGSLLIFDEVVTGFRVAYGGMQHVARVRPDLTILGKIIGGGLPMGAFGGRRVLMDLLAPGGPVYQAGTFAGHPLAMAAGVATLDVLRRTRPYRSLAQRTRQLAEGMRCAADGQLLQVQQLGSLLSCFFTAEPVTSFQGAQRADTQRYARFFHAMLEQGVLLPPSPFESWFISTAHTSQDVEATVRKVAVALRQIA